MLAVLYVRMPNVVCFSFFSSFGQSSNTKIFNAQCSMLPIHHSSFIHFNQFIIHISTCPYINTANYIHYGNDIGIDASLSLDSPSQSTFTKRKSGQSYLESKLAANPNRNETQKRGQILSSKFVDCRFALAKVCMPLMRELEFTSNRNFVMKLYNRKQSHNNNNDKKISAKDDKDVDGCFSNGMFEVDTDQMQNLMYVGNDAVHTLGIESFHSPIQEEINKRMSLIENEESNLRFAPIALNPEIEKNVDLILGLTGMDQVCVMCEMFLSNYVASVFILLLYDQ